MSHAKLPPSVRAETFIYSNGQTATVYRAPFESDGPHLVSDNGQRVLVYMYAAYVFRWTEGTSQLDIGHGDTDNHMGLFTGVTITGRWSRTRLVEYAQAWTVQEFERFAR